MPSAGNAAKVSVATTFGGVYTEVDGINDVTFDDSRNSLDVTDFKDGVFRKKIMGLRDLNVGMSGDAEFADTLGQTEIRTRYAAGTQIFVQVLVDGTNGFKAGFKVVSQGFPADVEGKAQASFAFELSDDGDDGIGAVP